MPAEPVDRLAADAAEAGPERIMALPIGRRRNPEARHQPIRFCIARFAAAPSHAIRLLVAKPPCPSGRPAALRRERASEPVGPHGMRPPIGIDRKPGHRRRESAPHRMGKHRRWKNVRQRLVEPRQRLPVNFVTPFRHAGPPFPDGRHSRGGVKISSTAGARRETVRRVGSDLLISDGCDWSGVIAKLFAKSMRPTRKAG
jgi:hypothetical protein